MNQHIYLNPDSGMITTVSDTVYANEGWLYIGQGNHKKVINWLIQLQGTMGDFIDSDLATLQKSWDSHEM